MIQLKKVGIIGTGHVGSRVAFSLATQGLADELYMADIDKEKAIAQAMDINDAVTYLPHHVVAHACAAEEMTDCDIIVISAGPLPEPWQSRLDTLPITVKVLEDIIPCIKASGFSGIIVSISNPADVVAAYIQRELQYPKHKILSTGTALDSARFHRLLSEQFPISHRSLTAYMLGEHGDSSMAPWSHVQINGKPLDQLQREQPESYPSFDREKMVQSVHEGGSIVQDGKGSTEFGIGSAAADIIRAIFHNEHRILPCSVLLNGEYGEYNVFASVPVMLSRQGIEQIIEYALTEKEAQEFHHSCNIIREFMATC